MRYDDYDHDRDGDLLSEQREKTKRPSKWKVLLHNDDYTTMDFVIHVLQNHFHKSEAEATHIMLQVHHRGIGTAGIYPREIAETKVAEVTEEARANEMPLRLTTEEV